MDKSVVADFDFDLLYGHIRSFAICSTVFMLAIGTICAQLQCFVDLPSVSDRLCHWTQIQVQITQQVDHIDPDLFAHDSIHFLDGFQQSTPSIHVRIGRL